MYKYAYITTLSKSTEHLCMYAYIACVNTNIYADAHVCANVHNMADEPTYHTTNKFIRMYV